MINSSCNHLPSFALFLEHGPSPKVSDFHQNILGYISYIGCTLSVIGLGVIILTFILFKQWREELKHKALFHLSIVLVIFLLLFMAGVEKSNHSSDAGCRAVAVLLHFALLASFAWMGVEAFIHYLNLVKVFGTYIPRFLQKASLFAWGVPLLAVGIFLGIDINIYNSNDKYCWVSKKAFYYAVAAPILSLLTWNFGIFSVILYSNTCGRSKEKLRTNQSKMKKVLKRAKTLFSVLFSLGLSWIFGFLAVYKAKVLFQYLFTVTTTLQGFFIFIFFICVREKTRVLWLGLITSTTVPATSTSSTDVQQIQETEPIE